MKSIFAVLFFFCLGSHAMKLKTAREIPLGAEVISYGPELSQDEISDLFTEHSAQFRGRNIEFNLRCKWEFGLSYGFSGIVSQQSTPTKDENAVISITINTSILCRN